MGAGLTKSSFDLRALARLGSSAERAQRDVGTFRFLIDGTVREEGTGLPLGRIVVRAYDKDVFRDDTLGEAITDESGRFEIRFTDLAFRDAVEQRPDIYLRVFASDGIRELLSTRASVRRNARAHEHYEIRVPAER